GSAIADNRRAEAPSGMVRAFDARTGRPRWSFDPLLHHSGVVAGHANVWAPRSVDEERGRVFLPTSSPSPDFWGGKRPGNNDYANSVVALRAETGERVWSYQTVHHDVWDYDLPAQPTLARINTGEGMRDVVIQPTKQGFVFVLDRDTGRPGWAGGGRAGARAGRGGRARAADAAVSTPRAAAAVAADFGRRCVRPDSVLGARCLPRAGRRRAQRGPLYAAIDARHDSVSDARRRRELGRRRLRSRQPDPLCQYFARDPHYQTASARRRGRRVQPAARARFRTAAGYAVRDDARGRIVAVGAVVQQA